MSSSAAHVRLNTVYSRYTVGWVDIGTGARVPLRIVVYLKKRRENDEKLVFSSNHFSVAL
jgi:hypothetical protein